MLRFKMPFSYYYDLMSQPCRALYILFKMNNVPFEDKPVALRKGEHFSEEYKKKVSPFSLVPVIIDGDFRLTESIAIAKYVIRKYNLPDHWYPQHDMCKQARVEEYLHWQHFNTRAMTASLFQNLLIIPRATGKAVDQEAVENFRGKISKVAERLETYFLKDRPYLGGDELSIADLFGICEVYQLYGIHEMELYEKYPAVKAWLERVKTDTSPHFEDANKMVNRVRDVYQSISAKL